MTEPVERRERMVYDGLIFSVYRRPVVVAPGRVIEYETVRCPDAVRVYPVTDAGTLLMISEHRAELGRRVLRVVSGRVEPGEDPLAGAARELHEELGLVGGTGVCFATSRPMLKVEHTVHHVVVRGFERGDAAPEPLEDVVERPIALDAIDDAVWSGDVTEDVIALNLLRLRRLLTEEAV